MIKPTSDHILIEPLKEEKKKGGIILPDTIEKEKSEKGKVIAVGAGKMGLDGKRIAMEIKKGDVVIFTKYGPQEVKIPAGRSGGADKEYLIVREEDILAIIG